MEVDRGKARGIELIGWAAESAALNGEPAAPTCGHFSRPTCTAVLRRVCAAIEWRWHIGRPGCL